MGNDRESAPYPRDHRPLTRALWLLWLLWLLFDQGSGNDGVCTDFLAQYPALPALRLLGFPSKVAPCGTPLEEPQGFPEPLWHPGRPSVVIVPGRRPPAVQPSWVREMAGALRATGPPNVLAVDWLLPQEQELVEGTLQVGRRLAELIRALLAKGSSPEKFHLIGFGVGAHVAGVAGASLNGTIGRITGLDPFGPKFTGTSHPNSLDYTDAQFVDIIHTNFKTNEPVAALGSAQSKGHVDFYVGTGHQLPGCPKGLFGREKYVLCSHRRAHQLFLTSIGSACPLTAFPCWSVTDFHRGLCTHCNGTGLQVCPQLGYNITWLPQEHPIPFPPLTAVLDITSAAPYCVTPFLLELHIGGHSPLDAQLLIRLRGGAKRTSTMLLSGPGLYHFEPAGVYQFLVSADLHGDFQTISLEFYTQRFLYLEWRKRKVKITHLMLTQLPPSQGITYQAWNITAVESHTVEVRLTKISRATGRAEELKSTRATGRAEELKSTRATGRAEELKSTRATGRAEELKSTRAATGRAEELKSTRAATGRAEELKISRATGRAEELKIPRAATGRAEELKST